MWAKQKHTGFTIVELLIVIVVIGILAAITIVAFNGVQNRARVAVIQSDLKNAVTQIGAIYADAGAYPVNAPSLKKSDGTRLHYASTGANNYCISAGDANGANWYRVSNTESLTAGACTNGGASWVAKAPTVNQSIAAPSGGYVNGVTIAAIYPAPAGSTNILGASTDLWIKIAQASPSVVSGLAGQGTGSWIMNDGVAAATSNKMIVSRSATDARSTMNGTQYQANAGYTFPTLAQPIIAYVSTTVSAVWPYAMTHQEQQGALAWLEQYAKN